MNNTWKDRLKALMTPSGYHVGMRRSLQTIILYEAKRGIEARLKTLRPYQRKAAFMEQCFFLLDSLDFIFANQKMEVLWRTMTSRVPLDGETAWARLKGINRELATLAEKIKPYMMPGRSHNEAVDLMVQELFQEGKDDTNKGKPCPSTWEHAHNHVIMAFRLYYNGDKFDENFPPPAMCPDMSIPRERPKKEHVFVLTDSTLAPTPAAGATATNTATAVTRPTAGATTSVVGSGAPLSLVKAGENGQESADATAAALDVDAMMLSTENGGNKQPHNNGSTYHAPTAATAPVASSAATPVNEDRRRLLKEVRDHLDILKEFEGVIPDEEIAKRKRELFLALPPAPMPAAMSGGGGGLSHKRAKI